MKSEIPERPAGTLLVQRTAHVFWCTGWQPRPWLAMPHDLGFGGDQFLILVYGPFKLLCLFDSWLIIICGHRGDVSWNSFTCSFLGGWSCMGFFFFDPTKTFRVVLAQLCVTFSLLKYLFSLFNCFIYPQNSCCFYLREIQNSSSFLTRRSHVVLWGHIGFSIDFTPYFDIYSSVI